MDFDHADDPSTQPGGDSWLDAIGNFLSDIGDAISDFVLPDVPLPGTIGAGPGLLPDAAAADLPNDGFYQSLPGIDSTTGIVLDQTAQLIDDIDEFAEETFGEQAWQDTLVAAQADPYGLLEGIETPAEMQLRFAQDDAAHEASFRDWQSQQEAISDADAGLAASDKIVQDSEDLLWNTDQLLRYG